MKSSLALDAIILLKLIRWYFRQSSETRTAIRKNPSFLQLLQLYPSTLAGFNRGKAWLPPDQKNPKEEAPRVSLACSDRNQNPLADFFWSREEGPGIWKWAHYFEVYHRHFARFIGMPVRVVEIGIYSGGSLDMWKHYFGPLCTVYGIDIQSECKTYEGENVRILIGDQADRGFWNHVREQVPSFDIVIDDGGHTYEQQMVTLEETLPYLSPGGVYICEDIHGTQNRFAAYIHGLGHQLNRLEGETSDILRTNCTPFQREIHSIHLYPYLAVIEKADSDCEELTAPKRGTQWQPFEFNFQAGNGRA